MEATRSQETKSPEQHFIAFPKKDIEEQDKITIQLKTVNANIVRGNILLGKLDPTKNEYHEITQGLAKLYHVRCLLLVAFDTVSVRIEQYYMS